MLKRLREAVPIRTLEIWSNGWILLHENAPAHKALSVKYFLAQKLITEMEHPPYSPDLALNDFWLFPNIKSSLKGRRFQDTEDIKKSDDSTKSYSTTGVPKMFPIVAASLAKCIATYGKYFKDNPCQ
jgi:histone-lysine N-methyltransferase SETMAR